MAKKKYVADKSIKNKQVEDARVYKTVDLILGNKGYPTFNVVLGYKRLAFYT